MSYTIFGFLNFHVSRLNHETFKLCLQNTLNMLKTTKVYFGVLQSGEGFTPTTNQKSVMKETGNEDEETKPG